jgi:hypothetical protein
MKILLQADSVVSGGLYFKAVTNWLDFAIPMLVIIAAVILHVKGKDGKDPLPILSAWINLVAIKLTLQVSQSTILEPPIVIDRILLKLKGKKYNVIEVTDNSVKFKERPWVLMWNFQAARRLDGGSFKIDVSDNGISVSLHYYLNLLPLFVAVAILEIATIYNGAYEGSIFFAVFFLIGGIIQIITSRGVAKGMIKEIINYEVVN